MNVSSVPTLSVRASVSCHPPKDLLVLVNLSEAKDLLYAPCRKFMVGRTGGWLPCGLA